MVETLETNSSQVSSLSLERQDKGLNETKKNPPTARDMLEARLGPVESEQDGIRLYGVKLPDHGNTIPTSDTTLRHAHSY